MLRRMPFVLLPVTAVLLFAAGLFTRNHTTIDIQLQDTMVVIAQGHILGMAAFFLFLLWLVNIATYKVLFSNKLIWFHILTTLVLLLFLLWYASFGANGLSIHLLRPEEPGSSDEDTIFLSCIAALAAVQLVFVANLLIGLYRKTTK